MEHAGLALGAIAISTLALFAGTSRAASGSLCVAAKPACFTSLQAAIDAAQDGDVIHVDRGTFTGGVTIDKSIALLGSGAGTTTISGGGPVVTIGLAGAATQPTVRLDGLTITGGLNA